MRPLLPCLFGAACIASAAGDAGAADWYVDNGAAGAANGRSWSDAWPSFATIAWPALAPGDTLYVSGGSGSKTYAEALTIGASGAPGSPISIRVGADSGHQGIVRLPHIRTDNHSWITIDGRVGTERRMEVSNPTGTGIYTGTGQDTGLVLAYLTVASSGNAPNHHGIQVRGAVSDSEIVGCSIHDNYDDGVNVYAGGSGAYSRLEIHDSEIYANGGDGIQGASGMEIHNNVLRDQQLGGAQRRSGINVYGATVDFTKIYDNTIFNFGQSLIVVHPQTSSSHILVWNNVLYKDATNPAFDDAAEVRGIVFYGDGLMGSAHFDDILIANNTIVDMGLWGIDLKSSLFDSSLGNAIIANNVIYNCYTSAPAGGHALSIRMSYDAALDNVRLLHNVVSSGASGSTRVYFGGATYTDASINAAANSSSNAFVPVIFAAYSERGDAQELQPGEADTAARDRGFDLADYFATDRDGVARPQGAAWDVGAYEAAAQCAAGAEEICGDGIDNDCDGVAEAADCDRPGGTGDVDPKGCSCAPAGGDSSAAALLLTLLARVLARRAASTASSRATARA